MLVSQSHRRVPFQEPACGKSGPGNATDWGHDLKCRYTTNRGLRTLGRDSEARAEEDGEDGQSNTDGPAGRRPRLRRLPFNRSLSGALLVSWGLNRAPKGRTGPH